MINDELGELLRESKKYVITNDQLIAYGLACIKYGRWGDGLALTSIELFTEMQRLQKECRKIEVPEGATHFVRPKTVDESYGDGANSNPNVFIEIPE